MRTQSEKFSEIATIPRYCRMPTFSESAVVRRMGPVIFGALLALLWANTNGKFQAFWEYSLKTTATSAALIAIFSYSIGYIFYAIYRAIFYNFFMFLHDKALKHTSRRIIIDRYIYKNGKMPSTQTSEELFRDVMTDAPKNPRRLENADLVHVAYQCVLISIFYCALFRENATLLSAYAIMATIAFAVGFLINGSLESEEYVILQGKIPELDAAAFHRGLIKRQDLNIPAEPQTP